MGVVLFTITDVQAQEHSHDWPCQQREVEQISQGQNWPFPFDPENVAFESDEDTNRLIAQLSLRRTTPEEAQIAVEGFVEAHPELTLNDYGWIYAQILEKYNTSRAQIIDGIKRYDEGQQIRAEEIDALTQEIKDATAADNPDYDKIDQMEVDLDWNTRIYNDREDALSYVCESPILIEKQAYAIAQAFVPYLPEE